MTENVKRGTLKYRMKTISRVLMCAASLALSGTQALADEWFIYHSTFNGVYPAGVTESFVNISGNATAAAAGNIFLTDGKAGATYVGAAIKQATSSYAYANAWVEADTYLELQSTYSSTNDGFYLVMMYSVVSNTVAQVTSSSDNAGAVAYNSMAGAPTGSNWGYAASTITSNNGTYAPNWPTVNHSWINASGELSASVGSHVTTPTYESDEVEAYCAGSITSYSITPYGELMGSGWFQALFSGGGYAEVAGTGTAVAQTMQLSQYHVTN